MRYPDTFPCPLIEGFSAEIEAGVIRGESTAHPRQRRVNRAMTHTISLSFLVKEYDKWMAWIDAHGWHWFEMDLPGALAGSYSRDTAPQKVRLIGGVTSRIVKVSDGYQWRVDTRVEMMFSAHTLGPDGRVFFDWISAETPDTLPLDWVEATFTTPDWVTKPLVRNL